MWNQDLYMGQVTSNSSNAALKWICSTAAYNIFYKISISDLLLLLLLGNSGCKRLESQARALLELLPWGLRYVQIGHYYTNVYFINDTQGNISNYFNNRADDQTCYAPTVRILLK